MINPKLPGKAREGIGRLVVPTLLLIGLVAFDAAAFKSFALFGVRPVLLVVFICSVALQTGPWTGLLLGAAVGLPADLVGGHLIGLSSLSYAAAGLTSGLLSVAMFSERWVIVAVAVALGTVAEQAVYTAGAYAFGFHLSLAALVSRMLPVLLLYHLLLTPLVYPLGRWLGKSLRPAPPDTYSGGA